MGGYHQSIQSRVLVLLRVPDGKRNVVTYAREHTNGINLIAACSGDNASMMPVWMLETLPMASAKMTLTRMIATLMTAIP